MLHKKMDRARLFLSYDALKGFKEMLEEKVVVQRKELSEDLCYELNWKIHQLKEGDFIEIVYYTGTAYMKWAGLVEQVDLEKQFLMINHKKISLANIISIEK